MVVGIHYTEWSNTVRANRWRALVLLSLSLSICVGCLTDTTGVRRTNSLLVITETTGSNLPFSFDVEVGGFPQIQIEPNDSFLFDAIPVGLVLVTLTVPPTCDVDGENPRTVEIFELEPSETTFTVVCS